MEMKTVGIIALVIIGIGLLVFSFKNSFMNEPPKAGADQAAQMKASMERAIAMQKAKGGAGPRAGNSGGQAAPVPGRPQ